MHLLKSEVKSTSCSSSYEKMEGFFEPPKKQLVRRILQRPRLSLRKILSNMEAFKVSLAWRNLQFDLKRLEDLHLELRQIISQMKSYSIDKNKNTRILADFKKNEQYQRCTELRGQLLEIKDKMRIYKDQYKRKQEELLLLMEQLPNLIHPSVKETVNQIMFTFGEKPTFDYEPRDHTNLCSLLNLVDFQQASKVSGNGFYYLKNEAALLEVALISYAFNFAVSRGFTPLMTPDIIRSEFVTACGFQPKASNTQIYKLSLKSEDLCLAGTAEVPLAGLLHYQELSRKSFPIKLVGFGRAYRAEAGAGASSRGLFRVHQFSKVELFCVTEDDLEKSDALLHEICLFQRDFLTSLGLHAQALDMAARDLGHPAYRKIDIEAWLPGSNRFGEVSSASNCTDYQSRRLNICYRDENQRKRFVHTLNGTACAIPRVLIAILETLQQKDGSVVVPPVLRPFMMNKDVLHPRKRGKL
ncbi:uncharacterized protein LOC135146386 [Zophobas morio]|uniref:uncharacterized protein LOC135146386 n=1 Tax=Zophobas morio TaxID=2755281 RepID=UPI003083A393